MTVPIRTPQEALEAAAQWHDEMRRTYETAAGRALMSQQIRQMSALAEEHETAAETIRALSARIAPPTAVAVTVKPLVWGPMENAPKGCVTEDAGCRGSSEWFLGRVAPRYADGRPPFIVIRRRPWPQEDSWTCAGEAHYVPQFFDAWSHLHDAAPPELAPDEAALVEIVGMALWRDDRLAYDFPDPDPTLQLDDAMGADKYRAKARAILAALKSAGALR